MARSAIEKGKRERTKFTHRPFSFMPKEALANGFWAEIVECERQM
jgi:hypothetical protein